MIFFLIASTVCVESALADTASEAAQAKALDSTATQWSFQTAYQSNNYHNDNLDNGMPRPAGLDNFLQVRAVTPVVFDTFTLLPRITLRHYEAANGDSGLGNTEIFGLIIPKSWDWGTGRFGLGPLITTPGDKDVAKDEWGYGLATALVNQSGKWFYGVLFTQSWRSIDPENQPTSTNDANPLGIAPFLNYLIGGGWYVSNGDMVMQFDWDSGEVYVPIGIRFGKAIVTGKSSWNIYVEAQTSLIYDDWPGSAVESSYRVNVTYAIPVN